MRGTVSVHCERSLNYSMHLSNCQVEAVFGLSETGFFDKSLALL